MTAIEHERVVFRDTDRFLGGGTKRRRQVVLGKVPQAMESSGLRRGEAASRLLCLMSAHVVLPSKFHS